MTVERKIGTKDEIVPYKGQDCALLAHETKIKILFRDLKICIILP